MHAYGCVASPHLPYFCPTFSLTGRQHSCLYIHFGWLQAQSSNASVTCDGHRCRASLMLNVIVNFTAGHPDTSHLRPSGGLRRGAGARGRSRAAAHDSDITGCRRPAALQHPRGQHTGEENNHPSKEQRVVDVQRRCHTLSAATRLAFQPQQRLHPGLLSICPHQRHCVLIAAHAGGLQAAVEKQLFSLTRTVT